MLNYLQLIYILLSVLDSHLILLLTHCSIKWHFYYSDFWGKSTHLVTFHILLRLLEAYFMKYFSFQDIYIYIHTHIHINYISFICVYINIFHLYIYILYVYMIYILFNILTATFQWLFLNNFSSVSYKSNLKYNYMLF